MAHDPVTAFDLAADPVARRELPPGGVFGTLILRDGARLRTASWRHPEPRATVLLLHGRREFIEKYAEPIRRLLDRKLSVFTFDWRGQGGSTRMLANRQKGYIDHFETYLADLDEYCINVLRPQATGPVYGLAHSMGGHNLLRYIVEYRAHFAAAVVVAPMFGIYTGLVPRALAPGLASLAVMLGLGWSYLPGTGDLGPRDRVFSGNRLTSDPERFQDDLSWVDRVPDLACGGPTWGWLDAAFRSIGRQNLPGYLDGVNLPLLVVSGGQDRVVDNRAHGNLVKHLSHATHLTLPAARHEILKERPSVQDEFWAAFDHYLA